MTERFVVLGLGPVRSEWFRRIARWAHDGSIGVQFVKCVSMSELMAHVRSDRSFSAAVVDAHATGVDRDTIDSMRASGVAVFIVDDASRRTSWLSIGAAVVLSDALTRDELSEALARHAKPVGDHATLPGDEPPAALADPSRADLSVVCGPGGTGASTIAMALSQAYGDDPSLGGMVLLVDAARRAELAMLHDAGDVVPGIQEAVELHRRARPRLDEVRAQTFSVRDRRYDLLLGIRRPHHWSTLRPRAVEALFDSLLRGWRAVIVDTDGDAESAQLGGSDDVEHRTGVMRTALALAARVVVVGTSTTKGIYSLGQHLHELVECGVPAGMLVPVINGAPRSPQQRAACARALADTGPPVPLATAGPLFVPHHRRLDAVVRDGGRLPEAIVSAVRGVRSIQPPPTRSMPAAPERIAPGALDLGEIA